ncbi:hypothetical protein CIL05_02185 [Virgibacillus profundi]|uniref:Holin-like toxin n=1 Tax=Virgibacillus profundi TaxID=2024555 RepID=A0A2A2IK38_9BACI|nr:hypothetical protein CIL05_02185 [Virgibacillus profundi]
MFFYGRSANPFKKGVMLMSMYEVLMVLGSFGTLLIALLALVITLIKNK